MFQKLFSWVSKDSKKQTQDMSLHKKISNFPADNVCSSCFEVNCLLVGIPHKVVEIEDKKYKLILAKE